MLELRDAELELVEIVAGHEVQLLDEPPHRIDCALGEACATAAQLGGELDEELLKDVRETRATWRGHAASSAGAGGASRAAPVHPG